MKTIQLTQNQVTTVNNEDYDYLNSFNWWAAKSGNTYYAIRSVYEGGKKIGTIRMHRDILKLTNPEILGEHRDRNGLNNSRENLRIATKAQNNTNRRPKIGGSSKYLGVSLNKASGKFKAQIKSNGKVKGIGYFKTEEEAALAYNLHAEKIHGEFAALNIL